MLSGDVELVSRLNLLIRESIPWDSSFDSSLEKPSSVISPRSVHFSGMKLVNRPVPQSASFLGFVADAEVGAKANPDPKAPKRRVFTMSLRGENRLDQNPVLVFVDFILESIHTSTSENLRSPRGKPLIPS